MGYNTTVVVYNDALGQIEKDPEFGKNLTRAITMATRGESVDVPSGHHCNAAMVVETHHADSTAIVAVGGNMGTVLMTTWGWRHDLDWEERALKERLAQIQELKKAKAS